MGDAELEQADAALVARMARGDRAALSALYTRHAPKLLALLIQILRDRSEAEDVLHDVFLEAWQKAATYAVERGTVGAWLSLRARSRAIDRCRAAPRTRAVPLEGSDGEGPIDPSVDPARIRDHQRLSKAFTVMTPDEQEVIVLGYFEGLSSSEIAEKLGAPIGTVKSRTRSALQKLRGALGET
ncbi:MAG TPA: sigma-70 family RNA polymerase sigma factor [Polyangiaceae bacterium]|nr:sigma-70 family RNA polymerase sigma factor [Polyangiaceae bacterium]